ncbi:MAG: hypothetical protein KDJ38_20795 [Gammaproteobacteria bacterium]|nr:hypothetical protein [Gammaproteobacteria bacterium]
MKKQLVPVICIASLGLSSTGFAANSFDELRQLAQDDFRTLSEDLGAATSYKATSPGEPLGLLGFDVGVEITATKLDKSVFEDATGDDWDYGYLPLPKLHVHKGLPFNIDVGGFYSGAPDTDIKLWGGEIRYSILEGTFISPALSLRLTYSKLEGVDELELSNQGVELSISKGFAMITPYAGIGSIETESDAVKEPNLDKEKFTSTKLFAGFNLNLGVNFGVEVDKTGDVGSLSVKTGFRF